jgi:hypothetical protein
MALLAAPHRHMGHHAHRPGHHPRLLPAFARAVESALRVGRQRVGAGPAPERGGERGERPADGDVAVFAGEAGYCCAGEEGEGEEWEWEGEGEGGEALEVAAVTIAFAFAKPITPSLTPIAPIASHPTTTTAATAAPHIPLNRLQRRQRAHRRHEPSLLLPPTHHHRARQLRVRATIDGRGGCDGAVAG